MHRIITLLNQKNHYLEKFYSANESAILNFSRADFSDLEHFYQTREKILETIRYIDKQTEICAAEDASLDDVAKKEVSVAMAVKDEYVSRILEQDLEILSCIEDAKSSIIKELRDLKKTRQAVGGYKSRTFEQLIDEEA